ncbi:hypothetical protein, partial [Streptomyces sp. NPDC014805]|uniref:hypothetical protein n=1 Tax=Streptomyces sp. NPDC014805 TaxID=3364919 RepID=UPI003700F18F
MTTDADPEVIAAAVDRMLLPGRPDARRVGHAIPARHCLIIDLVVGRGELTDAAWERIAPLLPGV